MHGGPCSDNTEGVDGEEGDDDTGSDIVAFYTDDDPCPVSAGEWDILDDANAPSAALHAVDLDLRDCPLVRGQSVPLRCPTKGGSHQAGPSRRTYSPKPGRLRAVYCEWSYGTGLASRRVDGAPVRSMYIRCMRSASEA